MRRISYDIKKEENKTMSYENLEKKHKMSFQKTLQNYLDDYLKACNFEVVTGDFITEQFINELHETLTEGSKEFGYYSYTGWAAEASYQPSKKELKYLMDTKVERARKKKLTEKQIAYFHSLTKVCDVEQSIPEDWLIFKYELHKLIQQAIKAEPATPKQVRTLRKYWPLIFNEPLIVSENLTKYEAQQLFNKMTMHQGKLQPEDLKNQNTEDVNYSMV